MTLMRADHLAALDMELANFSSGRWGYVGMTDVLLKGVGHGFGTDTCLASQGIDQGRNACYGQTRAAGYPLFAGLVRIGELMSGINHALVLNVGGCAFSLPPAGGGNVWPAHAQDDDSGSTYVGRCMTGYYMGSLIAIPKSVNINSLGLVLPQSINIAKALQNYGAYSGDRNGYTTLAFDFAIDANAEWQAWSNDPQSGADMARISDQLRIVANSYDPTTGGPPRGGVKLDGGDGVVDARLIAPPFDR